MVVSGANKFTKCFGALDRAIAIVAREEFTHLRQGLRSASITANVAEALRELQRLQEPNGQPPSYENPWVALCYILWYQPGQTFLAYRILEILAKRRTEGELQIVDFGCGALATEIAVDIGLAVNQFSASGPPLESVVVDSLDPAEEMIRLGESISRQLLTAPNWPADDSILISDRHLVDPDTWDFTDPNYSADRWLCGFHVVYETNSTSVRSELAQISELLDPSCIAMTTHSSKRKLLDIALPSYGELIGPGLPGSQRSLPHLDQIAKVRNEIRSFAVDSKLASVQDEDVALVKNYMKGVPDLMQSVKKSAFRVRVRDATLK